MKRHVDEIERLDRKVLARLPEIEKLVESGDLSKAAEIAAWRKLAILASARIEKRKRESSERIATAKREAKRRAAFASLDSEVEQNLRSKPIQLDPDRFIG